MADAIDIAEAVKDALNSAPPGTFSPAFVAVREWAPFRKVEELPAGEAAPLVIVGCVAPWDIEPADRARDQHRCTVQVGIQKKLGTAGNAEIDPLARLGAAIHAYLRALRTVATTPPSAFAGGEVRVIGSAAEIRRQRAFFSLWSFTYQVVS